MPKRVKLSPIIQITPQGTFRVQFSRGGQKFDRTFKVKSEAQNYVDKFAADTLTFEAFVENTYKRSQAWRKLKKSSRDGYGSRLTKICSMIGHLPLASIDNAVIEGYLSDRAAETTRLGKPPSADTLRQELVIIGKVMNVAVYFKRVSVNPVSDVEKPKQAKRKLRVSHDQRNGMFLLSTGRITYQRVFRGRDLGEVDASARMQEAGRFLFILSDLGGRASELAGLREDDVDFANECIHLDDTKKNEPGTRYFGVVAARLIKQQMQFIADHPNNPDGLLFPARNGSPHDYQYSVDIVRKLGLVSPDFHSHACRREFVSNARELGYRDADLARDIGVSIATLARYDESTGKTAEERERRRKFNNLRTIQLRDSMGDQTAAKKLGEAVALAEAHGDDASEIAVLDDEYCVKVEPQLSTEEQVTRAIQSGKISSDTLLQLALEAKAREAQKA